MAKHFHLSSISRGFNALYWPLWAIYSHAVYNTHTDLPHLHIIQNKKIRKIYGRSIFQFSEKLYIDFQSDCINLQSHQKWSSIPLSQYPHYNSLSFVVLFLIILTCIRYNCSTQICLGTYPKDIPSFHKDVCSTILIAVLKKCGTFAERSITQLFKH